MQDILRYKASQIKCLQRRLNAIFVRRRDSGQSVDGIYRQLVFVERIMSERGIFIE